MGDVTHRRCIVCPEGVGGTLWVTSGGGGLGSSIGSGGFEGPRYKRRILRTDPVPGGWWIVMIRKTRTHHIEARGMSEEVFCACALCCPSDNTSGIMHHASWPRSGSHPTSCPQLLALSRRMATATVEDAKMAKSGKMCVFQGKRT